MMDIEIIYRIGHQHIELRYEEPARRKWQVAAARARDYLKNREVTEATKAVDISLSGEWEVARATLDHLAYTYIPPIKLTSMEAHLGLNLLAASNLYLERTGKPWKQAREVIYTMAEIAPVALDPVELPTAAQLGYLDMSHWPEYQKLRTALGEGTVWISMMRSLKWLLELAEYPGTEVAMLGFLDRLHQVSEPLQYTMNRLGMGTE